MSNFSASLDLAFGGTQTAVSVVGCALNVLSFVYFATLKSRNRTSKFFQRVYTVITFNDFCICFATFPVIEAAFSPDRIGSLFSLDMFCSIWALVWVVLPQMSIFLVGMLSVSRLLVLRYPTRSLYPKLAYIVPGSCVLVLFSVFLGLRFSELMFPAYTPEWLACSHSRFSRVNYTSRLVTEQELRNGMVINVVYNVIPVLAIFFISASFVVSLFLLARSSNLSLNVNSSTKRQREATKTVIIVTLAYIIFNIPYTLVVGYVLIYTALQDTQQGLLQDTTVEAYVSDALKLERSDSHYHYHDYVTAVICISLVSWNSMINPAIYFWRIKHFQQDVVVRVSRVWRPSQVGPGHRVTMQTQLTSSSLT